MIQRFMIDSQTVFERRFFKSGHGWGGDQKRSGIFRLVNAKNMHQESGRPSINTLIEGAQTRPDLWTYLHRLIVSRTDVW